MSSKMEGVPDGWEFVRVGTVQPGEWSLCIFGDPELCKTDILQNKNYVIVRKVEPPKPVYIPWTYETVPIGLLVKVRVGKQKGLITGASERGARINCTSISYDCLLSDWIQLDGTPCGTVEAK